MSSAKNNIVDINERKEALDPEQSFIVQAPAGSGKTELLTQRFLNLLITVDKKPEEVLAITFTKKAANEMRQRIKATLALANKPCPKEEHLAASWAIAKAVLKRNEQENWNLLENPNRLRIKTIDSFCAYLSSQLPILSGIGGHISIADNPQEYYNQAVINTITMLNNENEWSESVAILLNHLDNNIDRLKNLLTDMLSHRDQWLPYIIELQSEPSARPRLEQAWQNLINDTLKNAYNTFPTHLQQDTIELANYSANSDYSDFPQSNVQSLEHWKIIANLFLTKSYTWRKTYNTTTGFPINGNTKEETSQLRALKKRMTELSKNLESESLRQALKECLVLPYPKYTDQQWLVTQALFSILPMVTAQLMLVFKQQHQIDFIEMSQRALQALQHDNCPTDLALCLDNKIKHILVDEFQDTSTTQFKLLELLTKGWQQSDGRTLFVVGDPMQSIYRFRAAEVGLFIKAKQFGINDIRLHPLQLSTNFRSAINLVEETNAIFATAFPDADNMSLGAIEHTCSKAVLETQKDAMMFHHCDDKQNESSTIADIIMAEPSENTIAILVKSRRHLENLVPLLQSKNIEYQAVEIENLSQLQFINDLLSLTQALQHFADRLAWLAILRAPWTGLLLSDLYIIANDKAERTIWQSLNDIEILQQLSTDGQKRIQKLIEVMTTVLALRGKLSINKWVHSTWLALAGPATLSQKHQLDDANTFFETLKNFEQAGTIEDMQGFTEQLDRLYSRSNMQSCRIQLMTIHKAKGLEFDTVILPALESYSQQDKSKLLLWQQRISSSGQAELLLAPIKSHQEKIDSMYEAIRNVEKQKSRYEKTRLLYVAMTRAKKKLHLLGSFDNIEKEPRQDSFLYDLWAIAKQRFIKHYNDNSLSESITDKHTLSRLSSSYKSTLLPTFTTNNKQPSGNTNIPLWQPQEPRIIGVVTHILLDKLSVIDHSVWPDISENLPLINCLLKHQGLQSSAINNAANEIIKSLENVTSSKKAKWILDHKHSNANSEFRFRTKEKYPKTYVIDRTFIDNNKRWIIDYKTSSPSDNNIKDFLMSEKLSYETQISNYAREFVKHDNNHPIHLGLYFPMIDEWLEWEHPHSTIIAESDTL